jgi:hypothetical protein
VAWSIAELRRIVASVRWVRQTGIVQVDCETSTSVCWRVQRDVNERRMWDENEMEAKDEDRVSSVKRVDDDDEVNE